MLANYGYADGSGEFFITIDTDRCDGCGRCVQACPAGVFEVGQDDNDPLRDQLVARVADAQRRQIAFACAPCKSASGRRPLPCQAACPKDAIAHSW
ncbi:MAG: 4Fe-4S binding protein [Chloroflexi bacterium]|nr:4Fe-4S binding protein [Chloroflexota bacterium]